MWKNLSISVALLLSAGEGLAQDRHFLTGRFGITKREGSLSSEVGPTFGYRLNAAWHAGLALNYATEVLSSARNGGVVRAGVDAQRYLVSVAPFVRLRQQVDERLWLYGQCEVGFGWGRSFNQSTTVFAGDTVGTVVEERPDIRNISVRVGPGVFYQLGAHWGLSADWGALRYERRRLLYVSDAFLDQDETEFGIRLDPGLLQLGLNWQF